MSRTRNREGLLKNNDSSVQLRDVLDAIQDQSRIVIALQGNFANTTDAARRLAELGIPPTRVAALLGKPVTHITSAISKARKKSMADGGLADMDGDSGVATESAL